MSDSCVAMSPPASFTIKVPPAASTFSLMLSVSVVRQHQQLRGSYRAPEKAWLEVVDFMREHQETLRHMITHRVPLSGAYEGFALARSKVATKVMVQPGLESTA